MDAFLAMKLTRHRLIQAFKTYTHEVQYQAAKADYGRGQGVGGRRTIGYVAGGDFEAGVKVMDKIPFLLVMMAF
jgi:hypothetical protein